MSFFTPLKYCLNLKITLYLVYEIMVQLLIVEKRYLAQSFVIINQRTYLIYNFHLITELIDFETKRG